jgi:hypothetical protein
MIGLQPVEPVAGGGDDVASPVYGLRTTFMDFVPSATRWIASSIGSCSRLPASASGQDRAQILAVHRTDLKAIATILLRDERTPESHRQGVQDRLPVLTGAG